MTKESGDLFLIYNGEIFNHADLRPDLERAGHRYTRRAATRKRFFTPTRNTGRRASTHFRGMFAFAIWDQPARTPVLRARPAGIKPFYYYWDGRLFAFASEIKALLEHPAISAAFEDSSLGEYLAFGYTSGERTLFRNIRKLMPGHHLTLRSEHRRAGAVRSSSIGTFREPGAGESADGRFLDRGNARGAWKKPCACA